MSWQERIRLDHELIEAIYQGDSKHNVWFSYAHFCTGDNTNYPLYLFINLVVDPPNWKKNMHLLILRGQLGLIDFYVIEKRGYTVLSLSESIQKIDVLKQYIPPSKLYQLKSPTCIVQHPQ